MTAAQVPVPPDAITTAFEWLEDKDASTGVTLPTARPISQGDTSNVPGDWNYNAFFLDLLARFGAGVKGVLHGLVVSDGGGLTVDVSAGRALIEGVVENKTGFTGVVVTQSANNFIWLKQDGTIEVKTTTSHPTTPGVFIGVAVTDTDSVTSVVTDGVIYIRNGIAFRTTTDDGVPTDTPNAGWAGITKTATGTYLWIDGDYVDIQVPQAGITSVEALTADQTLQDGPL